MSSRHPHPTLFQVPDCRARNAGCNRSNTSRTLSCRRGRDQLHLEICHPVYSWEGSSSISIQPTPPSTATCRSRPRLGLGVAHLNVGPTAARGQQDLGGTLYRPMCQAADSTQDLGEIDWEPHREQLAQVLSEANRRRCPGVQIQPDPFQGPCVGPVPAPLALERR